MNETTGALREAGVLWLLDGEYGRVVDAAIAVIEADASTDAVDVLAASGPQDPFSERLAMTDAALDSLGAERLPTDADAVAREAAGIFARRAQTEIPDNLACDIRGRLTQAMGADAAPTC